MSRVLSIDEHRALVEGLLRPLTPVRLPLTECFGLILAEDVEARIPAPPFTNSAMDGFAVRHCDIEGASRGTPVDLPVAGDIPAGDTAEHELCPGTALRIMTGAPIPVGADTVVKVEWTDHEPGIAAPPSRVRFFEAPRSGANIRHRGEAMPVGAPVLSAGALLDGAALAAVASAGYGEILVVPRPRVVIAATGAELVAAGEALEHGRIPDSNSILLEGLVREADARVVARIITGDSPAELRAALDACPDADLVLTAGGISAGAYEVVRSTLAKTVAFHHVAQQPGGPQGIGTTRLGASDREVPVVCLPGNPVSVFVSFHVYVAGALAVMAGRTTDVPGASAPASHPALAGDGWSSPEDKTQFIPLRFEPDGSVAPVHALGSKSHLVASLPKAQALGVIGPETSRVEAGDDIRIIDLRPSAAAFPILGEEHPCPTT